MQNKRIHLDVSCEPAEKNVKETKAALKPSTINKLKMIMHV
jgi:hypothetical protein